MGTPIERGVPKPQPKRKVEEIVPELAQIEVGESIFIPNETNQVYPPVSSTAVMIYGLRAKKRFDAEYTDDGLRVWRTE